MILGFQPRFVPAVADGTKPHTIRAGRRWAVGMSIQFYRNVRQKDMTKIREDATAKVVQQFVLTRGAHYPDYIILIDEYPQRVLTPLECQELAIRDGFEDFKQLVDWLANTHGIPFTGQLICWTDIRY